MERVMSDSRATGETGGRRRVVIGRRTETEPLYAESATEVRIRHAAEALERRVATVHERVACPKCRAPVGERCWHMGYHSVPHNISRRPIKNPHRERAAADGIRLR